MCTFLFLRPDSNYRHTRPQADALPTQPRWFPKCIFHSTYPHLIHLSLITIFFSQCLGHLGCEAAYPRKSDILLLDLDQNDLKGEDYDQGILLRHIHFICLGFWYWYSFIGFTQSLLDLRGRKFTLVASIAFLLHKVLPLSITLKKHSGTTPSIGLCCLIDKFHVPS
jgi:hypothetical protein